MENQPAPGPKLEKKVSTHHHGHHYHTGAHPRRADEPKENVETDPLYIEANAVESVIAKISRTYEGQEGITDYLYNLQLFFPPAYSELLKGKQLLPVHDWAYVIQVNYKTFEDLQCPICLSDPYEMIVPHMGFCGHIFCLPCILRHLLNSRAT